MPNDDGTMNAAEERAAMEQIAIMDTHIQALTLRVQLLEDASRWLNRSIIGLVFVVVIANLMAEALID